MIRLRTALVAGLVLGACFTSWAPRAAFADQATVKEVARINNCPPKKVDVYQQTLGTQGETIWRVECNLPKAVGDEAGSKGPDALLISSPDSLCELLRLLQDDKK